ncbi:MAG: hypothetical protein ABI560_07610 [Myxococcales bacterium]
MSHPFRTIRSFPRLPRLHYLPLLPLLGLTILAASSQGCDSDSDSKDSKAADKGPGAALKCASSGKNAFDTFGTTAFVAVNEAIFTNVGTEVTASGATNLGDSFGKIGTGTPPSTADDAAAFKGNLAAFLVYAYGGPSVITYTDGKMYTGPQDMVSAHAGLGITSAQYDYFIANVVVPALTSSGVTTADVSSCFAPIVTDAAFKASIVGH